MSDMKLSFNNKHILYFC